MPKQNLQICLKIKDEKLKEETFDYLLHSLGQTYALEFVNSLTKNGLIYTDSEKNMVRDLRGVRTILVKTDNCAHVEASICGRLELSSPKALTCFYRGSEEFERLSAMNRPYLGGKVQSDIENVTKKIEEINTCIKLQRDFTLFAGLLLNEDLPNFTKVMLDVFSGYNTLSTTEKNTLKHIVSSFSQE